jgi:hypothetical protein
VVSSQERFKENFSFIIQGFPCQASGVQRQETAQPAAGQQWQPMGMGLPVVKDDFTRD